MTPPMDLIFYGAMGVFVMYCLIQATRHAIHEYSDNQAQYLASWLLWMVVVLTAAISVAWLSHHLHELVGIVAGRFQAAIR